MLFHSQVFLLAFLPPTLGVSYLLAEHRKARLYVLIIASLGFYGYWDLRRPRAHALMGDMLTALPEATRKVFLVVPYHRFYQPLPGSSAAFRYRECNRRMANLAASVPNSMVVDFMIPSEITFHDENYWDDRHYTRAGTDRIVDLVAGTKTPEQTGA